MNMKRIGMMVLAAFIGAFLVVMISLLKIDVVFKSVIYAVLVALFVYVVGIIMRIHK